MAKARVYVELDRPNVRKILKEDSLDTLKEVGEKLARAAGPEYQVEVGTRSSRAVVNVIDPREDAMYREMSKGTLARALGSVSQ